MDYSTIFLWISSISTFIYAVHLFRSRLPGQKLPPGPTPLPIVGSLFKLGDKPNESLALLAKTYGPLMTMKLGSLTTVVVSSAQMAKEVLQKNDQFFAGRTVLDALCVLSFPDSSMVWSQPNHRWRNLRRICNTQIFTTEKLDANQSLRRQKVNELVAHVRENCVAGRAMDIGRATFVTSLNLLSNTIFSVDLLDLNSKAGEEFKELVWKVMEVAGKPNLSDYFPLLRPFDLQGSRHSIEGYFRKLNNIFDRTIDQRLKSRAASSIAESTNDFLDALLDHSHENGVEFTHQDIKALLVDMFCAGTDTSTTTLEWAMAELLRNPDAMRKARTELAGAIGLKQQVEESDIAKLPFLQAVVKETLRLHPPVPLLIPHRAMDKVEVCGFTVPKNAQVIVNAWAIGRDDSIWEEPNSFLPDRFLACDIDFRGRNFELIPFGAGRRICPGLPLAFRMVHLMLASLLHSFAWKLPSGLTPDNMDMRAKFGITLQIAQPLEAIPVVD